MRFMRTTALGKIAACIQTHRYSIIQGGTSAGKTIAILIWLISYAQTERDQEISVVTQTAPQMADGCWRDLMRILHAQHIADFEINRTEKTLTNRSTGSRIHCFALDDEMKARGPRRDVLFVNESNRVKWSVFEQLQVRTTKRIIVDFNPTARFWAHDELKALAGDQYGFLRLTYQDNEALSPSIIRTIEAHKPDKAWWRVYGEGEIGELEGSVYSGWMPWKSGYADLSPVAYGMDFGYSPDPTAVVAVYEPEPGAYLFRELLERTEMTSDEIVAWSKSHLQHDIPLICDSARPEIIAALDRAGLTAIACIKTEKINGETVGRLSQIAALAGQQRIWYDGEDLEREYLGYRHVERKGIATPDVQDGHDHCLDALRYAWYWVWRKESVSRQVAEDYADDPYYQDIMEGSRVMYDGIGMM